MKDVKLFSFFRRRAVKRLVENFFSLSLLKVVGLITPLITLPYLARVIGPDGFGAIAFASSIIVFVETITDWGFNYTATRDAAVAINSGKKNVSNIFSEVIIAKFCLMLCSFVLLLAAIAILPSLKQYKVLLLLTFLYIPGHILFPEWLFQAYEQMRYITILNVLSKILFTILIFFVIREKSDYIYQPLLSAGGYFLSGFIAMYLIRVKFDIRFIWPSLTAMFSRLKRSTNMFISLILPNFYTNFSTVLLKVYYGETITGLYDAGKKLLNILDQVTQVLSRVFFPYLAHNVEKHSVYVKISGIVCVFSCLFMFFGGDLFIKVFYSSEFADSIKIIKIFAFAPIGLFLMNTYGVNYLVLKEKEEILRNIIIVCSVFGFVLSWIMTKKYSYVGAAVTLVVTWNVRGLLTYLVARKEKQNESACCR